MKKQILTLLLIACAFLCVQAQDEKKEKYTILLTGASFASPNNGWFELGCEALNARAINRAIGGEAIANTANKMVDGTLYSKEELEEIDAFVIMQVHNRDVFEDSQIRENYLDYKIPFDRSNYAAGYDYVIKRYITECYNLKFDEKSKYYGTQSGKPAVIILCTHWHDGRPLYNSSVRQLGERWGLPVVEFDKYIGFSKDKTHPVTGQQYSLIYTHDNKETIDGVVYGWHPLDGKGQYIQQRMGAIFTDLMKKVLPLR